MNRWSLTGAVRPGRALIGHRYIDPNRAQRISMRRSTLKGPNEVPADETPPAADELPNPDQKGSREMDAARAAEDDDLEEGLTALSHLATGRLNLKETLLRVAQFASRAIPGASGVGLTLIEEGRADTMVATESFVT